MSLKANPHGGARPKQNSADRRGGVRKGAGRTPDIVAAAERVAQRLANHAHRFSDEELNRIGNALRSGTGSVETEFTRRDRDKCNDL